MDMRGDAISKAMTLNVRVAAERFELLKAELTKAFTASESDYKSLDAEAVIARNAGR